MTLVPARSRQLPKKPVLAPRAATCIAPATLRSRPGPAAPCMLQRHQSPRALRAAQLAPLVPVPPSPLPVVCNFRRWSLLIPTVVPPVYFGVLPRRFSARSLRDGELELGRERPVNSTPRVHNMQYQIPASSLPVTQPALVAPSDRWHSRTRICRLLIAQRFDRLIAHCLVRRGLDRGFSRVEVGLGKSVWDI